MHEHFTRGNFADEQKLQNFSNTKISQNMHGIYTTRLGISGPMSVYYGFKSHMY